MKKYEVSLPFCGYLTMVVEADSEDESIRKSLDVAFRMDLYQSSRTGEFYEYELCEWDTFRYLVRGNVFYGSLSEAEAFEMLADETENAK